MAYRLKRGKSIEGEVRRLAIAQLRMAVAALRRTPPTCDDAIHAARRHVKKVRALARLVRAPLGSHYRPANRRLRRIGRMLAPLTDGEAVVDTLGRVRKAFDGELPAPLFAAVRARLIRRRNRAAENATTRRVLPTAIRLLRAEQRSAAAWTLPAGGFGTIAPGLSRSYREAKIMMAHAARRPTTGAYHAWRRRVKDHWLQLRLLERRCNGGLLSDQHRLETLDGYLGECHNVAVLQRVVRSDTLDSRKATASLLRLLRRYQRQLRSTALTLGAELYTATPREFVAGARRHWRAAKQGEPPAEVRTPWQRAA